jgi:hypothetical protein
MNHDSSSKSRTTQLPVARPNEVDSTTGGLATIQPGDWVQTDEGEVGKIASVDATSRLADILKLDKESLRITSVPFPIDRMVKIQR